MSPLYDPVSCSSPVPPPLSSPTVLSVRQTVHPGLWWEYLECGVHFPLHCDQHHWWDTGDGSSSAQQQYSLDDYSPQYQRASNLLFGCLSAANGLKNAFVLVQISRFQQIIGVHTLQAPSEVAKVRMTRTANI